MRSIPRTLKLVLPAPIVIAAALVGAALSTGEPDARLPDGGVYYGPLADGLLHGEGRMEWANGAHYEGGFHEGVFSGTGRYVLPGGDVYQGEFRQGMMHGEGRLEMPDGTVYTGQFADDAFNGQGVMEGAGGYRYEGAFRDGNPHGEGELRYADGSLYEGEVAYGEPHGQGRFEEPGGGVFEGTFRNGRILGEGTYRAPSGEIYTGEFRDWRLNGEGEFRDSQGNIYRGTFEDGMLVGTGTYEGADGSHYEGGFQGFQFHGEGTLRNPDGSVYEGDFRYGYRHGEGTLTYAEPRDDGAMKVGGTWQYGERADPEAKRRARAQLEEAVYAQAELLDQALAGLTPGDPGRIELYLLTLAGDAEQAVFRRESEFVTEQFARRFGTKMRSVALVNSRNTLTDAPMATATSLKRSLEAIGERMNAEQDILFLYLTSHGSQDHELSLRPRGIEVNDLPAAELASMLEDSGIQWKVVVVSACYAGGFIEPLQDEHTLILTAARADRQSFGCADENDFTYFGRAFFERALPDAETFEEAFRSARGIIAEWESEEDRTPSLPQMQSAEPIRKQLARWRASMEPATTALNRPEDAD